MIYHILDMWYKSSVQFATDKVVNQNEIWLAITKIDWLLQVWVSCGVQSTFQSETQSGNLCMHIKALFRWWEKAERMGNSMQ